MNASMKFQDDPNLVRHDMWFSNPKEVVPFLENLLRENPGVPPKLLSAALMQARKNLVQGSRRECLKAEVSRVLGLSDRWSPGTPEARVA
jgi:hypothetical protein